GKLGGSLTRIAGCRQPSPALDGSLVLYQRSSSCDSGAELHVRDLSNGSDTVLARLRSAASELRLAGRFAAVAHADRIDVLDRAAGGASVISTAAARVA